MVRLWSQNAKGLQHIAANKTFCEPATGKPYVTEASCVQNLNCLRISQNLPILALPHVFLKYCK